MIHYCNRIIEYSFYALFLLVPLSFSDKTYELFEFNKMWLTFGLAVIVGTAWCIRMAFLRHVRIQRTPLDIPILLFFLSQIIATIFSLDSHVSLWGYYSRFNGGLLSTISYIVFYYAFVSNFRAFHLGGVHPRFAKASPGESATPEVSEGWRGWKGSRQRASRSNEVRLAEHWREENPRQDPEHPLDGISMVKRLLKVSIVSGFIVALWGLSSHFGYDPTCFLFRGTLDVSCWTQDFQPKVRIFSTFGQPNWLAAYLAILTPIAIASFLLSKRRIFAVCSLLFAILFYIDLLFTRSQSGFIAVWTAIGLLAALSIFSFRSKIMLLLTTLLVITFGLGLPIGSLEQFTLPRILEKRVEQAKTAKKEPPKEERFAGELGGTDSKKIRLIVWRGALDVWRHNPLFGTGVETFAFAYYKHRPQEHNLTSEWDFLYNKAHNEYLNYLATTGILGFGSYMLMIGTFLVIALKQISKSKFLISKQIPNPKSQLGQLEIRSIRNLELALLASYISILVSNFFGFSVVMIQVFFFLIPAFVFVLSEQLDPKKTLNFQFPASPARGSIFNFRWVIIASLLLTSSYLLITLLRFWVADTAFALGYNLNKTGEYQTAYLNLHEAAAQRPQEPVFQDELALNDAILSVGLHEVSASDAAILRDEAIAVSDSLVATHPNNVVFWKTRVRIFYALGQVDEDYLKKALEAVQRASSLAPTDAKVSYNLGLLYGQTGDLQKAVETLNHTLQLKPNYRDAYYALGLFYRELGENEKAVASMRYILTHLAPEDEQAKQALKSWGVL